MRKTTTMMVLVALATIGPAAVRADSLVLTFSSALYMDAKEAPFNRPEGIACADPGTLVVADTGNARLVLYSLKEGAVEKGTEIKAPQLVAPVRVQLEPSGNILALDRKGNRIVRFDAKGSYLGTLTPKDDTAAAFAPVAMKVDPEGNVWVVDASKRVVALTPDGAVVRSLEIPKGSMFTDVSVGAAGMVYAVDAVRAAIWTADKAAKSFTAQSRTTSDALGFPIYVTGMSGKLVVVDQAGNGIVILGNDGTFMGRQLSLGAKEGLLNYPGQVCTTGRGDIFLADRNNNRVDQYTTIR